jgi:hypothetical protein
LYWKHGGRFDAWSNYEALRGYYIAKLLVSYGPLFLRVLGFNELRILVGEVLVVGIEAVVFGKWHHFALCSRYVERVIIACLLVVFIPFPL